MLKHFTLKHLLPNPGTWYYFLSGQKLVLRLLFLLPLFFFASSFNGRNPGNPADFKKNAKTYHFASGGDFSLDFTAAAPLTYNHITGGGAYDDRTIGRDQDIVESLQGGDFNCGDIVTFLTQIRVGATATGSQTIALDYSFLGDATGQPGVALAEIVDVAVNYGNVGGDGAGNTDAGISDDGGSEATLVSSSLTGPLFDSKTKLLGKVSVNDLEAGETVVLRVDVRIACDPNATPSGNLQGDLLAAVTVPDNDAINVGNQTIPFKNVDEIVKAGCALDDIGAICSGSTNTHTATAKVEGATYNWTLSGDATFEGGGTTAQTTAGPNELTSTINVVAGAAGSYTLSVEISKDGVVSENCNVEVTVNKNPVTQTLNGGSFCESDANGAEVTTGGSESGVDYQLYDANGTVGNPVAGTGSGLSFGVQPVGTYYVIATTTGSTCSTTFGNASVTKNPLVTITTGSYGPFCANDAAVLLNGTPAGGVWSGTGVIDNGDGTYKFDPATAGAGGPYTLTYSVGATSTTCANSGTTTVTVRELPTLTVHNLTNVCPANTVNLASAVDSYTGTLAYYTSATGTTTVTNPASVGTGTYYIQATSTAGCKVRKAVTVTINACWGCTPGYWKNRKSTWSTIRTTNDELSCINAATGLSLTGDLKNASFWTVFGISLTDQQKVDRTGKGTASLTLVQAVGLGDGSGYTQLARAATAALLNSCALKGSPSGYPYTSAEILATTRTAFTNAITTASRQAALDLAKKYDIANNGVCIIDNSGKTVVTQRTEAPSVVEETPTKLAVATYPNPYSSNIRFVISNPKAGQGTLEVFNVLGQKVNTVYKGFIPAGNQSYNLSVPSMQRTTLIYRLSVGSTQVSGKLLHAKE